jgi:hypothetical protein
MYETDNFRWNIIVRGVNDEIGGDRMPATLEVHASSSAMFHIFVSWIGTVSDTEGIRMVCVALL